MKLTTVNCFSTDAKNPIPITLLSVSHFPDWLKKQSTFTQHWIKSQNFIAEPASFCMLPDESGNLSQVICGAAESIKLWSVGHLPAFLPEGEYELAVDEKELMDYAIGWGLGAYQFTHYKKPKRKLATLALPKNFNQDLLISIIESTYLVRDLINLPAEDLGPSQLSNYTAKIAKNFKAEFTEIVGDDLLEENFPCIHIVGRAADNSPRLLDLRWGNQKHPKVTLVGKGVCFDTGGLDIKPTSAMGLMKKDMGGAAHVLGLAHLIMQAELPICLRVLIPAVENAISGNAYRPGDVIKSRKGLTIEITNTDAEGRVVLADALTYAVSDNPELIIDMATLTGAARIALGTELPAMFCNDDVLANELMQRAAETSDPLWRLPLFPLYRDALQSPIADLCNASLDAYAGAITAALFLQEFVPPTIPWVHFDVMAWNLKSRPGRPMGGEAMGIRAVFSYLQHKYS